LAVNVREQACITDPTAIDAGIVCIN